MMDLYGKEDKADLSSAGRTARAEGLEFEDMIISLINESQSLPMASGTEKVVDINNSKTVPKPDLHLLNEEGMPQIGISVKNPGRRSSSIQMMIVGLGRFCAAMRYRGIIVPPKARMCLSLFIGDGYKDFESSLRRAGIAKWKLDYDTELRRFRCLWSSIPHQHRASLLDFFGSYKVKKALLEIVLKQGMASAGPMHEAGWMLWSDGPGKSDLNSVSAYTTDALIEAAASEEWEIRPSNSVLQLGPLTLQMKGSGNKKGSSYHSLQFNASLSDIAKFGIPMVSGNCEEVVSDILATEGVLV
jgi:hypothetical protein